MFLTATKLSRFSPAINKAQATGR
eukprot:Gb_29813 [translate_table: standard]